MSSPLPALVNVTIDDFDPLVAYSDYAQWTTPDPSVNPTWFNASRDVTGSVWHQGGFAESGRGAGGAQCRGMRRS